MTTTSASRSLRCTVIDGDSFATGTRPLESLSAAVIDLRNDLGDELAVVVPAQFRHRLGDDERHAFDRAVARGEIVTPPAGAVGGLTGFLRAVAGRADTTVVCARGRRRDIDGARVLDAVAAGGHWNVTA